jgi:hypothetical protein
MMQSPNDHWHLDRKVPIGIIVAMLMQFGGGLWFVSKLDARILSLEASTLAQHERDKAQDHSATQSRSEILRQLERIDEKLDRLIEKGARR